MEILKVRIIQGTLLEVECALCGLTKKSSSQNNPIDSIVTHIVMTHEFALTNKDLLHLLLRR
jgi:hypothetical protein